ncbi:hypothetical protein LOD99_7362 [Oopsacas minuta]|uniref:Uncharacterized protein n=1 Tax=Oopsacas minuta TaxID=111878 RepID=A0AAV7JTN6_9METZ|nr:hypothetical protein LOD99_7362 [Oopsacas minuta]
MKLSVIFSFISLSFIYNALCYANISHPILSTQFSARMRPSKLFEMSSFARGLNSLIFMNITGYDSNDNLMISEIDSTPSNESHILYQSYMNGREKKAYFIYEGQCYTHNIDGIPVEFLIVPSFMSFVFINFFNTAPLVTLTSSLKECTYHKAVDCEGWTAVNTDSSNDNITIFIHETTILHYIVGFNSEQPVIFDDFKIGNQTIDKFEPPKAANCN